MHARWCTDASMIGLTSTYCYVKMLIGNRNGFH
jgi:hypothetical protein